jgi:hypothetical protein
MRVLGLALAGVLALTAPTAAQTAPPGSKIGPAAAGPAPGIAQPRDGNGPGRPSTPNGWARGGHQMPGHPLQWNGGPVPPHWGPNGWPGGWGPYPGPGVPTYWVWGPSGGAFDYPFADWRGPTGGWGNP